MCIPEFLKRQGWDILILTIIRWRQDRTGKKENSRRVQPRRDFHRVEASRGERRGSQGNRVRVRVRVIGDLSPSHLPAARGREIPYYPEYLFFHPLKLLLYGSLFLAASLALPFCLVFAYLPISYSLSHSY